ncbi:hypothetical protein [Planctomicrobium sp. SH664]|uniref:hypothetical protein n=1 Tax=Planctomicrobium sp. SH664 TaxID=3448125 RepID=UPI003F5B8E77
MSSISTSPLSRLLVRSYHMGMRALSILFLTALMLTTGLPVVGTGAIRTCSSQLASACGADCRCGVCAHSQVSSSCCASSHDHTRQKGTVGDDSGRSAPECPCSTQNCCGRVPALGFLAVDVVRLAVAPRVETLEIEQRSWQSRCDVPPLPPPKTVIAL